MSDSYTQVRSYQRLFRPERRIYQVDGRRIPVPGGVPLAWLGWALAAAVAAVVLSQRSLLVALAAGAFGATVGASVKGLRAALLLGISGAAGTLLVGVVLSWLAWPLRLVVLPALVATLASHRSPDGRPAHRYLLSRLAVKARAPRRSLGRSLEAAGSRRQWAPEVWVTPDEHAAVLVHGRVCGPARLIFACRVVAIPARGRLVVRPAYGHRLRAGERVAEVIELAAGEVAEVRP
ncbi:MAG: hypothetical protein ACYC0H_00215 [Solirubrobacteraceae bacterium]